MEFTTIAGDYNSKLMKKLTYSRTSVQLVIALNYILDCERVKNIVCVISQRETIYH